MHVAHSAGLGSCLGPPLLPVKTAVVDGSGDWAPGPPCGRPGPPSLPPGLGLTPVSPHLSAATINNSHLSMVYSKPLSP